MEPSHVVERGRMREGSQSWQALACCKSRRRRRRRADQATRMRKPIGFRRHLSRGRRAEVWAPCGLLQRGDGATGFGSATEPPLEKTTVAAPRPPTGESLPWAGGLRDAAFQRKHLLESRPVADRQL